MKTFKNLHPHSKAKIRLEEIIRIEANINYSELILATGNRIILARTLKAYEKDLTLPFLRINKSCIVNIDYLGENLIEANKISMIDGEQIQISRRRIVKVSKVILSINH
jgi:DNA-binding LytR/AlgR family response regulator